MQLPTQHAASMQLLHFNAWPLSCYLTPMRSFDAATPHRTTLSSRQSPSQCAAPA
jgi:hypothetical protein